MLSFIIFVMCDITQKQKNNNYKLVGIHPLNMYLERFIFI